MDEAKKAELEAKYETIETIETVKGEAAFKLLDRRQRNRYLEQVAQNKIGEAADFACLATVVLPDRATFESWIDSRPGISMQCMRKLAAFNRLGGNAEGEG